MTDPYGQQPFGQPGGQPFGQPGQPQPGQAPPSPPYGQPGPYGQQPGSPYGQQAPYGQPAPYGQGGQFGPPANYASWGARVLAYLIDVGPIIAIELIGYILMFAVSISIGYILVLIGALAGLGWTVYNRWIQGGNTGQSLGKRVVGIKLISEQTRQPLGPLNAFLRDLCHAVDGIPCYVGYLWPLWDDKSQTFADKILSTIVVADDGTSASAQPAFGQPAQPAGGFPPPGGYGQQPGYGQPPQPGGYGQPQSGGFAQQQPQSGGFPPPGAPQPPHGAYGQPGFPPPAPQGGPFDQEERTQMLRPDAPGQHGTFGDQPERTQMLRPGGQHDPSRAEETQKIDPGRLDPPPHQ